MSLYYRGLPTWQDTRPILFRCFIMLGDAAMVALSYLIAFGLRFYYDPFLKAFPAIKGIPDLSDYLKTGPVVLFMWVMALSWQGGYKRITMPALDDAIRIFKGSFFGTILSMSAMFLFREISYSRLVFVIGGGFSFLFIYLFREAIKIGYLYWIIRGSRPHRVLILGNGYLSGALQRILKKQGDRAVLKKSHINFESVKNTILRSRINEVLVANPNIDRHEAVKLASFCEEKGVSFRLLPDILEIRMGEVLIDESLGIPTFRLKSVSLHGSAFFAKRIMDVSIASLVLGVFFIPLFFIAFLIKLTSSGPVFYHHERMGYKGRSFQFMKFRTMVQNADDLLEKLKKKSDRQGPVFKMKDDPRIIWIGKFLRRYSIDEIPQLINVLKGEMSVVGPRPQVIWETKIYDDWAKKRLNVLPGITGLWQVSGRAELTYEEMIELDIYYIEHWSPGLDIKIILRTIPAVFLGQGAY